MNSLKRVFPLFQRKSGCIGEENFYALFIDKTGILAYHIDVWAMTKTSTLDYRLKRAGMVRSRQNESRRITTFEP